MFFLIARQFRIKIEKVVNIGVSGPKKNSKAFQGICLKPSISCDRGLRVTARNTVSNCSSSLTSTYISG